MFSIRMIMFSYQAQNSGIMVKNYALNIFRMQDKLRQHVISLIMLQALLRELSMKIRTILGLFFFTASLETITLRNFPDSKHLLGQR